MSRDVRMVPKNWNHPKNERGRYIPLLDGDFENKIKEWNEGKEEWDSGIFPDYASEESRTQSYEEWAGRVPNPDHYMPKFKDEIATHYMMYETTSEGTPISPAFETKEELAKWLYENNTSAFGGQTASYEGWLQTINRGGSICSCIMVGGKIINGVDA